MRSRVSFWLGGVFALVAAAACVSAQAQTVSPSLGGGPSSSVGGSSVGSSTAEAPNTGPTPTAAPTAAPTATPALPPAWVATSAGCRLWAQNPLSGISVTWTGQCPDNIASGDGVATWKWDDKTEKYEGSMVNGRAQGRGVNTLSDGSSYEGDWVDGHGAGKGVFKSRP